MSASLETLVVAAYMFADEAAVPRSGPEGATSDAELVALAVAQASIGIPSDRQFLGLIGKVLPGWFPHLPCQSQYNRRLRRLAPLLAAVQLRLAELLASGKLRLADGTLIGVANYPGCASRSAFAGTAAYGYCAANEKEYEPVRELTTAQSGCLLIADKGYWGCEYAQTLAPAERHDPDA